MKNEEIIDESWRKGKCAGNKFWWAWFIPYSIALLSIGYYIQNIS
jgi:hypothetical protein